jgi:hypothetical protein
LIVLIFCLQIFGYIYYFNSCVSVPFVSVVTANEEEFIEDFGGKGRRKETTWKTYP